MLKPPFRIAVDTGGTFTDVVLSGAAGDLRAAKAPTTPERAFEAIEEALGQIGREEGLAADQLLAGTSLFIYGTTRATNAILTGSTSPTAFFTSAGFPDILTLREGGKTNPFDFTLEPRKPFVPRHLTFEIPGRIDSSGAEVVPLDEEAVLDAIGRFAERDVRDVGVCFLWSIANPAHELRVGELLRAHAPDLPFTLSHQFNPILREYRRASSTCLNASLRPLMEEHLRDVKIDLETAGFEGELLVVTSTGGCISIAEAAEKPLYCANSGPSLAPVAARVVAAELLLDEDLVVCDAGGTSFDVSLVREGKIGTTRETWLGEPFVGQMTGLSSAEVTSIGAGGGSIAWVDDGGLLRIGPESAGSVPGPVCYRRGGTMPTVTDAACVLGYLNPGGFLDGRMQLDVEAAGQAIREGIGDPLGLDLDSAAHAIIEVASEAMASAIREATINQGVDPRECTIVLGGGAGPTFGG
ncbi:MAG: 5-oxoprolinase, partial [Solirubrobacterales bacterium 70-9]